MKEYKKFYHVSDIFFGKSKILEPRIYENFYTLSGQESPSIERICVSDTLEGALSSSPHTRLYKIMYVYSTYSNNYIDYGGVYNNGVRDALICREHWIMEETEFLLDRVVFIVGVIDDRPIKYYTGIENLMGEVWKWEFIEMKERTEYQKYQIWKELEEYFKKEDNLLLAKEAKEISSELWGDICNTDALLSDYILEDEKCEKCIDSNLMLCREEDTFYILCDRCGNEWMNEMIININFRLMVKNRSK